MFKLNRPRVTPAFVIACLALLVALTPPTYAAAKQAIGKASIGGHQLKNNAVTSKKIKNKSVRPVDLSLSARPKRTAVGSFSTRNGFQTGLPANGTKLTIGSLTSDFGTGRIVIKHKSLLVAQGYVLIALNSGGSDYGDCDMFVDTTQIGPNSRGDSLDSRLLLPLAGSLTVQPGSYNVSVACESATGNGWSEVAVNVIAVPL